MRILLLVDHYLPGTTSAAMLVHDLACELRDTGHQPVVMTCAPEIDQDLLEDVYDGIEVFRVKTPPLKNIAWWKRAINEPRLSQVLWKKSSKYLQNNPCDYIVYYTPTIFFGDFVHKLKSLWQVPSYMVLRDIFPQWAIDAGLLSELNPMTAFFRRKEKCNYDAASKIGVQSPENLKYFQGKNWDKYYDLEVLHHWVRKTDPAHQTNYRQELSLENKTIFFFGGNLGIAQDIDNLLRLAGRLTDREDIHFLFVGNGSETAKIEDAAKTNANITWLPAVTQEEYDAMLVEFDIGLISLDKELKTHNIPGKLLGYLNRGIPVLASINPGNDLKEMVEQYQAGIVLENGQDDALYDAALKFADNPEYRKSVAENGQKLLHEVFSAQQAVRQILNAAKNQISKAA